MNEWHEWLVYTPSRPGLHRINATSYAVMRLCDGREAAPIFSEFRALAGTATQEAEVRQHFLTALSMLERHGLIERLPETVR